MSKKPDTKATQPTTTATPGKDAKTTATKTELPKEDKPSVSKDTKAQPGTKDTKESKAAEPKVPKDNVLVTSGLLEAYEYLQKSICKHGFPKGNVFEYAAVQVMKFEKKFKAQKANKLAEKLQEVRISMHKSKSPERGVSDHPGLHDDKKDKGAKKDAGKDAGKKDGKKDDKKEEETKKGDPKKDAGKKDGKKEEPKADDKKADAKKDAKKDAPKEEPKKEEAKKAEPKKDDKKDTKKK
mmetsp:Transcript_70868/g.82532  ORF Transcript_70868/g.82532 Transcript_70868/m.82532 type:complete len:239 (+) Transcript_70868:43-759(+)|eukprot:CAMPEP_0176472794 /NCGR_PEP_ID=MMETSP0127-20121128/41948_1 /TAXON_ID=938130 /ORGANISM="Platyophrya macrostoma, Strain WH" /LENGTH=238 /DNA_ID=CAMNT_0017867717 /DNA_START=14 /DNA_END=730 /DNA_ORIENTATION=-